MRFTAASILILLGGCTAAPAEEKPAGWEGRLGEEIAVEGVAQDAKLGALVETRGGVLWLDGLEAWPPGFAKKKVRVTGTLIRRGDMPVYTRNPGDPPKAGIGLPPGADLERARQRYLISSPKYSKLQE